ncbi:MAG TPA: TetR family transcriptional regulator [Spirochaetota bacterium]|nr:TetR family transcriptional regulator [Spirochaetota bacterium]HQJ72089.1 TetR family transcriptional regulator [Spirochaetota bacterium]HRS79252.1 TetR family transcriptional regulator [Spirochaetota bacterium]
MPGTGKIKKTPSRPRNSGRPFGRDDVVAAVIEAAGELFSRRGFDGVSVRDIAKKAGVNHGLIHRHFGSKENLRRQTLQRMADAMLADVRGAGSLQEISRLAFQSLTKHERFWRILARTILDGHGTGDLHRRFPIARHLTEQVKAAVKGGGLRGDLDPRMVVAAMFSFSCGFIMFEPFILAAAGLDGVKPDKVRDAVLAAAMSLLTGPDDVKR